jgi:hypothetical protein
MEDLREKGSRQEASHSPNQDVRGYQNNQNQPHRSIWEKRVSRNSKTDEGESVECKESFSAPNDRPIPEALSINRIGVVSK